MIAKNKKTYFSGLNEIRGIAAIVVLIQHIEQFKSKENVANIFDKRITAFLFCNMGFYAVMLFFILSGFLITHLLLEEKEHNGKINYFKFCMRRVLRIWPLYYLILITAFIIMPSLNNTVDLFKYNTFYHNEILVTNYANLNTILLYILFLPNVLLFWHHKIIIGASHLWSIGLEEQFYTVWPLFIIFINKKKIGYFFSTMVLLYIFVSLTQNKITDKFETAFIFQYLVIGSAGAYFYHKHKKTITRYSALPQIYILICGAISLLMYKPFFSIPVQFYLLSFLFLFFLYFTIDNNNSLAVRNNFLSKFGIISYGVYLYHPLIMFLVFPIAAKHFSNNMFLYNLFVYCAVFILSFIVSHYSYKYFESYFLRIKEKKFN